MYKRRASIVLQLWLAVALVRQTYGQTMMRRVGKFQEVFAWSQITYNINGNMVLEDRFGDIGSEDNETRSKRESDKIFFNQGDEPMKWPNRRPGNSQMGSSSQMRWEQTTTPANSPASETGRFFIQYNNVPMGAERYQKRLFIAIPRRRYGIPATLNYLDLTRDSNSRSPGLRPYPNLRESRALVNVYRTRADSCNRLWMVDTGLLEVPGASQQIQQPAIVVYDLNTDKMLFRYPLKSTDLPSANTPTGLASVTVEIVNGDCSDAFAYLPDLASYGVVVYSMRENDSWRVTNNYFHFDPLYGNLNIAGQRFQWNDGIFSMALSSANSGGCRTAYFHPMASTQEFSVSTCVLRNRTASAASNYWENYSVVGQRGDNSQSTMHDYHPASNVLFFADVGRNGVSCWSTSLPLTPSNMALLAQDSQKMSYPADLHVTGDEVWVIANTLPRFIYSRLDTSQPNFYIYRATVQELISGTVCESRTKSLSFMQN